MGCHIISDSPKYVQKIEGGIDSGYFRGKCQVLLPKTHISRKTIKIKCPKKY